MDVSYIEEDIRQVSLTSYIDNYTEWTNKVGGKNNFSFVYLNIGSIKNKFDEFYTQIAGFADKLDIIVIAEVKLSRDEYESRKNLYKLNGFASVAKCRTNNAGGGLLVYIRNGIKFELLETELNYVEGILLRITMVDGTTKREIVVLFLYRPPNLDTGQFIAELKATLRKYPRRDFIMCGDINIDLIKQNNLSGEYENMLYQEGFIPRIKIATREAYRLDALTYSCIDHLYYRGKENLDCAVYRTKISDHYMVCGVLKRQICGHRGDNLRMETKINNNKFCNIIKQNLNINTVRSIATPEDLYQYIKNVYNDAEVRATSKKIYRRRDKPMKKWINEHLLGKMKYRDRLFIDSKNKNRDPIEKTIIRQEYNRIRNDITKEIRREKHKYYKELIEKNKDNMKDCWKILNEIVGKAKKRNETDWESIFESDLNDKADEFARTFTEEVKMLEINCKTRLTDEDITFKRHITSDKTIYIPQIELMQMKRILENLDERKGPGIDGITAKHLKITSEAVAEPLTMLLNQTIDQQRIPTELKVAVIKPVHKSGSVRALKNYRPISILPTIDKVMERYIHTKVNEFLEKYQLLDRNQYGFRRNRGTIDLLEDINDLLNEKMNHRMHILCTFVDFSKAFDCIHKDKIAESLDEIGIRGVLKEWIKSYLTDRSFVVELGRSQSKNTELNKGVVQGSILGPLLYLVYINDMAKCFTKCKYFLYADDTIILSIHKNYDVAVQTMNVELRRFQQWCHDKDLNINSKKTKYMHIRTPHTKITNEQRIVFHDHECLHNNNFDPATDVCKGEVEKVTEQRYLGVVIDEYLSWEPHINQLRSKIRHIAGKFYRISDMLDQKTSRMLYCAMVESLINYGITVWGGASRYLIDRIERTQNCVIANMTQTKRADNEDYRNLGIMRVSQLYEYRMVTRNYFKRQYRVEREQDYDMRRRRIFTENRSINKYGERVRGTKIPKLLNALPEYLRNVDSISEMKRKLKEWMATADDRQ